MIVQETQLSEQRQLDHVFRIRFSSILPIWGIMKYIIKIEDSLSVLYGYLISHMICPDIG